jgi:hypothetical protein
MMTVFTNFFDECKTLFSQVLATIMSWLGQIWTNIAPVITG